MALAVFFSLTLFGINQPLALAEKADPAPDCKNVTTLEQWYAKTSLWRYKNKVCKPGPGIQAYSHTPIDAFTLWEEFWEAHSKVSDAVIKKYQYNLVTVKGTFRKAGSSFLGFPEIFFQTDNVSNVVACQFPKEMHNVIFSLKPGQPLLVSGTVRRWGAGILDIEDCTLLEPSPETLGKAPSELGQEALQENPQAGSKPIEGETSQ